MLKDLSKESDKPKESASPSSSALSARTAAPTTPVPVVLLAGDEQVMIGRDKRTDHRVVAFLSVLHESAHGTFRTWPEDVCS
jgi:hypothetical protein